LDKEAEDYLEGQKKISRDNGRTPMQWNTDQQADFTSGKPWLKVNPNFKEINVEQQDKDKDSILNYFRKMIQVRKANPVLIYGDYKLQASEHEQLYAYSRTLGDVKALVLLNFSTEKVEFELPKDFNKANILINNMDALSKKGSTVELQPYQAVILQPK